MNYRDTLNLPKTDFPMKANLSALEPRMLSKWEKMQIYERLGKERKDNDKFILHDGPPYANGLIHVGTALNKLLKDIVLKYKALRGFNVPFIVGWDCHGLPVEHQLFKELESSKHEVEVVDFRKKAKEFALKYVELQKEDFKKLGVFSDWDNPYLTLDPKYEQTVIKLLEFLVREGYVYRGRKPVNWCPTCETALAEAEVEYADKESDSIYLLFKTKKEKELFGKKDVYFLIWTTTPWTLISNVAVAVHPDYQYALVDYKGKIILIGQDFVDRLQDKFQAKLTTLKTLTGKELEGITLEHPFLERNATVVLADFVSKEEGSGCVHIAPGHGQEDFSLTHKYPLETIMPVNEKGVFDEPDKFKGKNIVQANEAVIKALGENTLLIKHEKIQHSYPHCWRCKNPIIFRATFQWFMNVDYNDLRDKLLAEAEKVRWVPQSGKERMRGMLILRPDWCLSRQRLWGVPIPALRCKQCNEVILNKDIIAQVARVFGECGSDSWFTHKLDDFIPAGFSCDKCGAKDFDKEYDILDVWFESGVSFAAVLKNNPALDFPADMYLEGSDQHRGWFQVSLIPSVAKERRAPFKIILTHGFTVDGEGRKMSKSLGNVIAPQEVIKKDGAEILRLWAAYSDYSEDVKISEGIIKQLVDIYRKIRNTIRFIMGNIHDFDIEKHAMDVSALVEVDRYMLSRTTQFVNEVINCYEDFSFYRAAQKIFNFCNLDLSSFYLDILKDRLYTLSSNSKERRSCQYVLYYILKVLLKVIAPILSFTAEEVYETWENLKGRKDSIFLDTIDEDLSPQLFDEELMQRWERILSLRDEALKEIEKMREGGQIGSSLEAEVSLHLPKAEYKLFSNDTDTLREVFIVSDVLTKEGEFKVEVKKASGAKCIRCWNWRKDIGLNKEFPEICARCANALKGGSK
ncbi:MAG: isoleucine--tRNA ligase [Candidatus Omnitrophota bacterium]|nr:MAG: isoleucine--tRNA ligase [Candidatus Omnitrophota bacterium]